MTTSMIPRAAFGLDKFADLKQDHWFQQSREVNPITILSFCCAMRGQYTVSSSNCKYTFFPLHICSQQIRCERSHMQA